MRAGAGSTWRRVLGVLAGLLAACLLAALSATPAGAAGEAVAGPAAPIGHAGRWIVDGQGRVLMIHGLNMVYKLAPYSPAADGFGQDDAAFLAANGFNAVRVGVIYKAVEPRPGVYDDAYLNQIAQTVALLARHGIVSLLDFHQDMYNELFQGEGFPDWAALTDGLPAQPQTGFPNNYFAMPALNRAWDHFWNDDPGPGGVGLGERFAAAWGHVAARFRGNPDVLGYELLNEPWPGDGWQQCAQFAGCPAFDMKLGAMWSRADRAIRAADPGTLVWYEPQVLFNYGSQTNLPPLGDPHAGMAFHVYCLGKDFAGDNSSCPTSDSIPLSNAEAHVKSTGDALMETEWGASDDPSFIAPQVQASDQQMLPWMEWAYCDCQDPTGDAGHEGVIVDPRQPPSGANLRPGLLGLLAEPYPQLVAGTPSSWSFDPPSKAFRLAWQTARVAGGGEFPAGAQTDAAMPALVYGSGYSVDVTGGSVVSAPGSGVLSVVACPGVNRVELVAVPGSGVTESCPPAGSSAGSGARRRGRARAAAPALRLVLRPRSAHARRRQRLRVSVLATVRGRRVGVRGALVRAGRAHCRSGAHGRCVLRVRFARRGRAVVSARARGFRGGRATLRVR